jgi:putative heme transporter
MVDRAADASGEPPKPAKDGRGELRRTLIKRGLFLLVTGVSLYLLAPSLLDVFASWRDVRTLDPAWVGIAIGVEAVSFVAVWELQRIVLRTPSWFAVGTSQLTGNAFGRIVPGGMATAGALQYRMIVQAGVPGATAASGLTATSVIGFATMLALPVLAIPAVLGGVKAPEGLLQSAYLGAAVFVLMMGAGAAVLLSDKPLALVARVVGWIMARLGKAARARGLREKLLHERDAIRVAVGPHWRRALVAAVGRWAFDYLALLAVLRAVGAEPDPSLVLLAFVAAQLLGMIPLTPGGLGFVEAGLTGLLRAAGVDGGDAVVATFAYRLVSFWLPLPFGLGSWWLFRRRYGRVTEEPDSELGSLPSASSTSSESSASSSSP